MQKYRPIQGQLNVFETRLTLNENFESIASNFAGDAFPTSNLFVGMNFYHTGEKKTYTLRQLDPVRWDEDTSDRLKNARNISLTGKVQSEKIAFDGSADAVINVTRVEADVCNGNSATATVAFNVRGAISSQNAPRHVWFSGINNETQREYANNFVYNPVTGTLSVPRVEGTASISERSYTADKAGADGNGANIAATYAPKNGAGAYGTWGINIGGRAEVANVADRVGNDDASMRFHWNGQGGQPTWLWGGNNPNDAYVWNPSNFNVNHANTANSAGTAGRSDTARRADSAGWADGAQRAKSAERADAAGWVDNANLLQGKDLNYFYRHLGGRVTPTMTPLLVKNSSWVNNNATGLHGQHAGDIQLKQDYRNFDAILIVSTSSNHNSLMTHIWEKWRLEYAFNNGHILNILGTEWVYYWVWSAKQLGSRAHPLSTGTVWKVEDKSEGVICEIYGINY